MHKLNVPQNKKRDYLCHIMWAQMLNVVARQDLLFLARQKVFFFDQNNNLHFFLVWGNEKGKQMPDVQK